MTNLALRTIRFRIHPCFWLVILSAVWTGYFLEIATLFGLIVIHELGHVAAARYFGWRITEIELLPFGGVAKTDEWGTVPSKQEWIVAAAGPAYNGVMIVFAAVCYMFGWWSPAWADFFVTANLWLAGFNLLPIFPLDGGRILQAVMSYKLPYRKCILLTITVSFILSATMLLVSLLPPLFGQPFKLNVFVISIFLLVTNVLLWRQKNYQYMRFLMQRQIAENVENKPIVPILVSREDTVLSTIKKWKKEVYHVIVVRDGTGSTLSVLPEEWLLRHFLSGTSPFGKISDLLD